MISKYSSGKLTWIDLESPSRDELLSVADSYGFHPVIAGELAAVSERSKIDKYDNALYMVLHFPLVSKEKGGIEDVEIDAVFLGDTLITTRYGKIDPVGRFSRLLEEETNLKNVSEGKHAGFLFFFLAKELYGNTLSYLDVLGKEIRSAERQAFSRLDKAFVARIASLQRILLGISMTMRHHEAVLSSFVDASRTMYGEDFSYYARHIQGEFQKIEKSLKENERLIESLKDTSRMLVSVRTRNLVSKVRTFSIVITLILLGILVLTII